MATWRNDLRHGVRVLGKSPVFAAIAILSLAIGIGANTAIFSVANALILRSLPYSNADRIAIVWQRSPGLNVPRDWLSVGQYLDIKSGTTAFEQVAAAIGASFNVTGEGRPERVDGMRVSSSFFSLFGGERAPRWAACSRPTTMFPAGRQASFSCTGIGDGASAAIAA
jgi:hypothetical protein